MWTQCKADLPRSFVTESPFLHAGTGSELNVSKGITSSPELSHRLKAIRTQLRVKPTSSANRVRAVEHRATVLAQMCVQERLVERVGKHLSVSELVHRAYLIGVIVLKLLHEKPGIASIRCGRLVFFETTSAIW